MNSNAYTCKCRHYGMRKDKETAFKLRLAGKSYTEIHRSLGVAKSTLSGWFSGLVLSDDLRKAIEQRGRKKSIEGLIKRNKNQTRLAIARAASMRQQGAGEIQSFSQSDLFLFGVALYWAEGYKRPLVRNGRERTCHTVSLTNSDPGLVKVFLRFLRECCGVREEKIKAGVRIFQHQNEKHLIQYWQKETNILPRNFGKVYYGVSKSSLHKRPFNRLPYGVIQVTVADTQLFHRIMGHIEGIKGFV